MSKICKIGAKQAILDNLKKNRVIASDGKILKQNALLQMHFVYKDYLTQKFGINRDLILTNTKHTYVQFNTPALEEVDALYGRYYPENERFKTNIIDNKTLTPIEIANKYIKVTETGQIALKNKDLLLNSEDLKKFELGMSDIFPEYKVLSISKGDIAGESLNAVKLEQVENAGTGVETKSVPGMSQSESDMYTQMDVVQKAIEPLLKTFKNVNVEWISPEQIPMILASEGKPVAMKNGKINAIAIRSTVFLVKGRVTPDTAIEEFMHMFVDTVATERPALYEGLKNKAFETQPALYDQISDLYPEELFGREYIEREFVTQALRNAYMAEREERPQGIELNDFFKLAKRFFQWVLEKLNKVFDNSYDVTRVELSEMPIDMTLQEVATFLNINDIVIPYAEASDIRFSITPDEITDDDIIESQVEAEYITEGLSQEQLAQLKKEKKLEKANHQVKKLKALKKRYEAKPDSGLIVDTLNKLIAMSAEYIDIIENDIETVSTTNFIGSPEFPIEKQKANKKFQSYGTFLHNFMEYLQDHVLFVKKEKTTPAQFLYNNYDFFENFYNENRDQILLEGLDAETLAGDMINIVSIVSAESAQGNLVIPELTTFGRDSMGRTVVGRIDYMVIRPDGTVATRDFKTNKVNRKLTVYNDAYLHNTIASKLKLNPDVHPAFESFPGRSKIASYLSQVGAYKRMFAQHGIKSVNDAIINIVYGRKDSEDDETFIYDKAFVKMLEIEGEFGLKYIRDENGTPTTILDPLYERVLNALTVALPVAGEENINDTKKKAIADINYIQGLNEDNIKQLIANLKDKIQKQLDSLAQEIDSARSLNADKTVLDTLLQRRTSLFEIQAQFDSTYKTEEGFKEIADQIILKSALDRVIELATTINKECKEIAQSDLKEESKVSSLKVRFNQVNDLENFLSTFNSILLENGVPENSNLIKEISEGIVQINAAKSEYIKVGGERFIDMLLKVPKITAEAMMKDYKAMIGPKVQKLQRIVNGDSSVFEKGYTIWLSSLKRLVGTSLGQPVEITDTMKTAAQSELNRINNFIKHEKFDRAFVKLYVENTFNNPEHGFYIGSTINTGFGGLSTDDLRASFGNSELALTAVANLMINMTIGAKTRFNQLMEDLRIDDYLRKAVAAVGGMDTLNQLLSERVTLRGKDGEKKDYMKFIGPIIQEYFNTYDNFDYEVKEISKKIDELIKTVAETPEQKVEKEKALKQLYEEKKDKLKKFRTWLVENAETKMRAEVYVLESALPAEVQEAITKLNAEIASKRTLDDQFLEDFELDDVTFDQIQQLELQIENLKKKAIEEDPSLRDVFENYQQYYTYDINWDKFNYTKNKMIKKYGEDSIETRTWLELNSDMIPTDEWYEMKNNLQDQINAFYGDNPILTDLYEKRRNLINKYKYKSKFSVTKTFNATYMTDDDAELLDEIDTAIAKEQSKDKPQQSPEDFKALQSLRNQLNNIRQTVNKPSFMRALDNKVKELLELYKKSETETDPILRAKYKEQFKIREDAFKVWYERNNDATYKLGTIVTRGSVNAVPKSFNIVAVPTDPSMMHLMPTSKYKTRYYKAEAYNPNYRGTLEKRRFASGEYALPKGISYDEKTGRWEVTDKRSKWYNPAFETIQRDPNLYDAYNTIVMDLYYNRQRNINANKLGLFFPGVMQNAVDSVATDGVQGLKREMNESLNSMRLKNSAIDDASNTYGVSGKNRITFSNNYMLDANLVTKDGINAIIQWSQQYEINQSMEEANLIVSPAIDFLKEKLRQVNDPIVKKQIQKVIDIMEFERNKLIFGQTTKSETRIGKRSGNKLMKMFLSAVSWGRLAFDPAMQTGNLVAGNVQTFLATQMKGAGTAGTVEDYLWAKAKLYGPNGFIYDLVSDWGGLSGLSLSTKIYRYMDPTLKGSEKLDLTSKTKAQRLLRRAVDVKDLAFVIQDKGEMEIAITTLLKNLKAYKAYVYETDSNGNVVLDEEGNKVFKKDGQGNLVQTSAYEALINVEGSVIPGIRNDVAMTEEDLEAIRAITHQEYMRHQGNYSSMTKSPIEGSMLGQLLMFFRKYLVPAVEVRFKGMFDSGDPRNWMAGEAQLGWWTGFFRLFEYYGLATGFKELFLPNFLNKNSSVDLYYRNKMFQVKRDILVAATLTMAYAVARSLIYSGDDDDDKELTWAQMQSLRVLVKVSNEARSLTPIPHIGKIDDYITNFSTFTTAFSEGKNLAKLVENLIYYTGYEVFDSQYMYELGYYQRREGRYEAGQPKFYKGITKLTGIENIQDIFDPQYALKQQYQGKK